MDQTLDRFAPPRRGASRGRVADLRSRVRSTALRASDPQVKLTRDAGPETTHSVVSRRETLESVMSVHALDFQVFWLYLASVLTV